MQHRKLVSNTSCPRCGERAETIDHIFRECPTSLTSFLHTRAVSFVVDCGPPSEFVKINFDDAYDANHHQSASEIVARNEEGDILLSCSEIHHGVTSAFAAEAIACRKAVQVGGEQEWSKVLIEGDSRNLEVDSVMCLRPNPTSELLILDTCL